MAGFIYINLIREYLFHELSRYEEVERMELTNIKYRRSDSVDCFELGRAKDNVFMFTKFAKDIMILLHMVESAEDFNISYKQFCEELVRRRGNRFE